MTAWDVAVFATRGLQCMQIESECGFALGKSTASYGDLRGAAPCACKNMQVCEHAHTHAHACSMCTTCRSLLGDKHKEQRGPGNVPPVPFDHAPQILLGQDARARVLDPAPVANLRESWTKRKFNETGVAEDGRNTKFLCGGGDDTEDLDCCMICQKSGASGWFRSVFMHLK